MSEDQASYTAGQEPRCTTHHICQCHKERMEHLEQVARLARRMLSITPSGWAWHLMSKDLQEALEEAGE